MSNQEKDSGEQRDDTGETSDSLTCVYTPFESTIFFHEGKFHERVIAALAYRAQTIPIDSADMAALATAPEHISPLVFVFAELPESIIRDMLARGFQQVYILSTSDASNTELIASDTTDDSPASDSSIIPNDSPNIPSDIFGVTRFTWADIHSYMKFIPGLLSLRVVEMMLMSAIPNYKSMIDDLRADDGQNLYDGLMSLNIPLETSLRTMCNTYLGFDQCVAMISRGKTLRDHRAYIARLRFEQAIIIKHDLGKNNAGESYLVGLVAAPDFNPDFLRQTIPGTSLILMWNYVCAPAKTNAIVAGEAHNTTLATGDTPNDKSPAEPNGFVIDCGIPKPAYCEYFYHVRAMYADKAAAATFLKKFSKDITHVNASRPYFSAKIAPAQFHTLMGA